MKKFLILGMGNIGLRHMQGLAKNSDNELEFYVFDKYKNYKKKYSNELNQLKTKYNVFDIDNIQEVININFNLIIIATTATNRPNLLINIIKILKYQFILIEKPICQSIKELEQLKEITNNNIYVNFPRRYSSWHRKIKKIITTSYNYDYLKVKIIGRNIGLACNASHYIDLLNFWTSKYPIKVDTSCLDRWHEAKRKGFFDVTGKLQILFECKHELELISTKDNQKFTIEINDSNDKNISFIDHSKNLAEFSNNELIRGKDELQSESTNIVYNLMLNNDLEICSLKNAIKSYEILLTEFIKNWNKDFNKTDNKIMIT